MVLKLPTLAHTEFGFSLPVFFEEPHCQEMLTLLTETHDCRLAVTPDQRNTTENTTDGMPVKCRLGPMTQPRS